MPRWLVWLLACCIATALVAVPFFYFRAVYAHSKRLRVVTDGRFYRSGQLTQAGLAEAIERYGIRTVLNLQNEAPDPPMHATYWQRDNLPESELCRRYGVKFVYLGPELLPRAEAGKRPPEVVPEYLRLLDDPASYPILIHCKAGLHRTGLLAAIYRIEYEGWSQAAAVAELKANGFGETACSSANDYVLQYLLTYRPHTAR